MLQILQKLKVLLFYFLPVSIIGETEDPDETRVFYTLQLPGNKFVDVMCVRTLAEGGNFNYIMQNHDGSTVRDSDGTTHPGYLFNAEKCLSIANLQYAKDYGKEVLAT